MRNVRTLFIPLTLVALCLLLLIACGGDDDDTGGASTTTGEATQDVGGDSPSETAEPDGSTTAAATQGSSGEIVTSHECVELMTADDVAEALGDTASDFENVSLGRQATDEPFTDANQCQWTDFNNTGDSAWLIVSFAEAGDADKVLQKLEADCEGEDMVSGLGEGACYPEFTGQLRVVKGSVYLDYFAFKEDGGDMVAAMRELAEKTLARLP